MQSADLDLKTALDFVIQRITDEAAHSGRPLDDEERRLLYHLPRVPTNPTAHHERYPEISSTPILRDFQFENLCELARTARLRDIEMDPQAIRRWEFAAAVLQLNRHPMSWLLGWASVSLRRPNWDQALLVTTGLIIVTSAILTAIGLVNVTGGKGESWKRALWISGGAVYAIMMVILYFAVQRFETWELKRTIEKRRAEMSPVH